jgi:hypothetical protein
MGNVAGYFKTKDAKDRYEHMARYDLKMKDYESPKKAKTSGMKILAQKQN